VKQKYLIIAITACLIQACKSPDFRLYEFDPRTLKENEIVLSEMADEITYIPLENSFPLGIIYNIEFINNEIYFTAKDVGIMKYDRFGKFVCKIGSIGRGPGQYIYAPNFTVDEKKGNIYAKVLGQIIKVYSNTGQFEKDISLKGFGDMIDAIKFHDSRLLVTYALQFGNSRYKWIVFDTLGNVIKMKARNTPIFTANSGGREVIYNFENKLSYWNNYIDTVFSILPDLNENPSFIISPGEHRIPRSKLTLEQVQQWKYLQIITLFETHRFFVIRYSYEHPSILLFDKYNKNSFLVYLNNDKTSGELLSGLPNDIDGGPFFLPESYFSQGEREFMVGVINPYHIKTIVSSNEFKNTIPKHPEKKKELEDIANSLKETDNPILMMVRLKK
jgi:hypothetical protein